MKKTDRRREPPSAAWKRTGTAILKGTALAGILTLSFLLLNAILISAGVIAENWMQGAVRAACALSAFIGGSFAVRRWGRGSAAIGPAVGTMLFLVLLILELLLFGGTPPEGTAFGTAGACLCGGAASAICAGRRNKMKR